MGSTRAKKNELTKGLIIVGPGWIALAPFWVLDDKESCNFQNMLVFGFPETSQNLMSLRQLLFSLYSVIHISIHPSKELCSKMAPGEVGVSLP